MPYWLRLQLYDPRATVDEVAPGEALKLGLHQQGRSAGPEKDQGFASVRDAANQKGVQQGTTRIHIHQRNQTQKETKGRTRYSET